MPFASMPTLSEWKKASAVTLEKRSKTPRLPQIDALVELYHKLPESRHEILFQLYRASDYWVRKVDKKFLATVKRTAAVSELRDTVKQVLCYLYECNDSDLDKVLEYEFGKGVHELYRGEDKSVDEEHPGVKYIKDETERRKYKLVFRMGKAHKHKDDGLEVYSTNEDVGKSGAGNAIFVMDARGRIYTGSYSRGDQHHSTFLAAGWALAAGEMEVEDGQVRSISPDSGHYQPGLTQMLNIAERLRTYLVDMTKVEVRLFIPEPDGPFAGQPKQKAGVYEWNRIRGDVFLATRGG